jgi:hypothetical protein
VKIRYGHAAPKSEKKHGHHQAPEVDLLAVSERMQVASGFSASVYPQQEQKLIACVHYGMNAFGDHGRAACHQGGRELACGNHKVCHQSSINRSMTLSGSEGHRLRNPLSLHVFICVPRGWENTDPEGDSNSTVIVSCRP